MADTKDKKDADPNAALLTVLTGIQKTMTELPGTMEKSVTTALSRVAPKTPAEPKKDDKKSKREPVDEKALEGMDRTSLVKHIVAEISEQLIEPLRKELAESTMSAQTDKLKSTWTTFMGDAKNKTMMDGLKDEVAAVIKQNPSLAGSPSDILALAKDKAPKKVKALEEANKKTAAKTDEKDGKEPTTAEKAAAAEAAKVATAFGGLPPSSGTPGASDDSKPQKVPLKEAVNQAYDEVLAALPAQVTGAET